jgi:hypothetical protein
MVPNANSFELVQDVKPYEPQEDGEYREVDDDDLEGDEEVTQFVE